MKEIKLSIPEYDGCLEFIWEDNYMIKTAAPCNTLTIEANREGSISLARHILLLAEKDVSNGTHFHFDESDSLEEGSLELIISKNEAL